MKVDFVTKTCGYTGHVPYRYEKVGLTKGNANQICQEAFIHRPIKHHRYSSIDVEKRAETP